MPGLRTPSVAGEHLRAYGFEATICVVVTYVYDADMLVTEPLSHGCYIRCHEPSVWELRAGFAACFKQGPAGPGAQCALVVSS